MLPFKTPALAALSPAPAAELSAGDGDRSRQVDATSSAAEPARGKHALAVVKKIVEVDTSAYSNTAVDARPPIDDDEEIHLAAPSRAVAYYPKAVVNEVSILLTRKMPSPSSLRADIGVLRRQGDETQRRPLNLEDAMKKHSISEIGNDDSEWGHASPVEKKPDHFSNPSVDSSDDDSFENKASRAKMYCQSLRDHSALEGKRRPTKAKSDFLNGKGFDDVILVFPFGADARDIDDAAVGLRELSFFRTTEVSSSTGSVGEPVDLYKSNSSSEKENELKNAEDKACGCSEVKSRAVLNITVSTFEMLKPTEYINDTLIDFWWQWIWRNDDKRDIHCFTTLFFTKLKNEGPKGVKRWTEKRGIDVFKKKFIFIPINKCKHWTLCVVVNPGAVSKHRDDILGDSASLTNISEDDPFPCLLFFDSLNAHATENVASTVREWLNSEWIRLMPDIPPKTPFDSVTMRIYSPKVPYQENSWDCGVYVCRYLYAMYLLRSRPFSYGDVGYSHNERTLFKVLITDSDEFNFNAGDIVRIRREFMELLERLSTLFLAWKAAEELKRLQEG